MLFLPVTGTCCLARGACCLYSTFTPANRDWFYSDLVRSNGVLDWCVTAAQLWPILTAFLAERDKIKERCDSRAFYPANANSSFEVILSHINIFKYFDM